MTEFVSVSSLWLPIVVAAIAVFFASFLVWMVLPHHRHDWGTLPDEGGLLEAMRRAGVKPGQYGFPSCGGDMKKMGDPEFVKKMEAGPVGLMVVGPNGPPRMGKSLFLWFVYSLVIGVFVAYLAGRLLAPGTGFPTVFRMSATTAFLAYSMAILPQAIWKNMSWAMVLKEVADGLAYGLLTGCAFGAFWPDA